MISELRPLVFGLLLCLWFVKHGVKAFLVRCRENGAGLFAFQWRFGEGRLELPCIAGRVG
jgi:hypothetical protein